MARTSSSRARSPTTRRRRSTRRGGRRRGPTSGSSRSRSRAAVATWLLKTEPSSYSFEDLRREKRAVWDGISNPVALRNLAAVRKGDTLVIYHTGDEKSAVGLATAVSDAYPDPKLEDPKRPVVDLEEKRALPKPVSLAQMKADRVL